MFIENVVRVADQQLVCYNDTVLYKPLGLVLMELQTCEMCYGPNEKTPDKVVLHLLLTKWTLPLAGSLLQGVLIGTNIILQGFSMNSQTLQIPY